MKVLGIETSAIAVCASFATRVSLSGFSSTLVGISLAVSRERGGRSSADDGDFLGCIMSFRACLALHNFVASTAR